MKIFEHDIGGNKVSAPGAWINTTEDVDAENAPFTLAKKDIGVGALQFSSAAYCNGEEPNINITRLKEMLVDFARAKGFGEGFEQRIDENRIGVAAASYHVGDNFIRLWFCSDERNVALVSYVCNWDEKSDEVKECEEIVRSIHFAGKASQPR